jgi:hypothetical protein
MHEQTVVVQKVFLIGESTIGQRGVPPKARKLKEQNDLRERLMYVGVGTVCVLVWGKWTEDEGRSWMVWVGWYGRLWVRVVSCVCQRLCFCCCSMFEILQRGGFVRGGEMDGG